MRPCVWLALVCSSSRHTAGQYQLEPLDTQRQQPARGYQALRRAGLFCGVAKGKPGNKPGNKIAFFGLLHRAVRILGNRTKSKTGTRMALDLVQLHRQRERKPGSHNSSLPNPTGPARACHQSLTWFALWWLGFGSGLLCALGRAPVGASATRLPHQQRPAGRACRLATASQLARHGRGGRGQQTAGRCPPMAQPAGAGRATPTHHNLTFYV